MRQTYSPTVTIRHKKEQGRGGQPPVAMGMLGWGKNIYLPSGGSRGNIRKLGAISERQGGAGLWNRREGIAARRTSYTEVESQA